jgi:hypothetical protein
MFFTSSVTFYFRIKGMIVSALKKKDFVFKESRAFVLEILNFFEAISVCLIPIKIKNPNSFSF